MLNIELWLQPVVVGSSEFVRLKHNTNMTAVSISVLQVCQHCKETDPVQKTVCALCFSKVWPKIVYLLSVIVWTEMVPAKWVWK